ncbi:Pretoxin HINT domain-containing protein [Actinopolyspora alba]|uniref:Pretoxin HINT domain-containing protein n=1 Tax=Actinopolyspora alba TaxID=673379 RepID=A0A1I2BMJ4_9ACTN|nr:Pretoxin HINT domain-containing protein [Actinopolyspora alba]
MADGSREAIEEVELGDRVLATDPETGETGPERVTATITGEGEKQLVEVTVDVDGDRGGATDSVTATGEHPFWVPNRDEWVDAEDLTAGDRVRTAEGEQRLVTGIRTWTALQRVHNLTINDTHTYYVALNGHDETLVHNSECGQSRFWSTTEYQGQRIYQRDDLVDPALYSAKDTYGRSNLKRMKQGVAPIGPDGKSVNLHHMLQTQDGPIAEVTSTMHLNKPGYGILHWKAGSDIPSGIDRVAFEGWKKQYWRDRAAGFIARGFRGK